MRTLWMMGILLALGARPATAQYPGDVSAKYDRFENATVVTLSNAAVSKSMTFRALYVMPGAVPSVPKSVRITVSAQSPEWEYLKCHRLALLADGVRVPMSESSHDGTVGKGYVIEHVSATISAATLNKIARAALIEGVVCNTEFSLSPMQISALKDFADQMRPARP